MLDAKPILNNKLERSVTVENVSIKLLIDKEKDVIEQGAPTITHHTHAYNELFVCVSGELQIKTDLGFISLYSGDVAIVPTNIPHFKYFESEDGNWCSVGFSLTKKSNYSRTDLYKRLSALCGDDKISVFKNLPEICRKVSEMSKPLPSSIEFLPAVELVSILSRLSVIDSANKLTTVSRQESSPDPYLVACLDELIQNRYFEPLSIGKVAETFNISTRQLSRIIKSRHNMTFHQVLTKIRLDNAVQILISTDKSVNKVLAEVGYTKSSLFYKDFSERFGTTPTEYRNTHKKV